ncbi:MAG: hypothetical protein HY329_27415, partial [Chloroflexi bacterium]|nr:hypothetical protein [Chloroflexota bacterium]
MRTMRAIRTTTVSPSRLPLVLAAVTIQMALGGVMAWSVYRIPLAQAYGWTISEVTLTYTIHYFAG